MESQQGQPLSYLLRSPISARGLRRAGATPSARVGLAFVLLVAGVAVFGPLFAPHDPAALVARPFAQPGESGLLLGADYLGRDALSRFLWGGRVLLALAIVSTSVSYAVGITLGLFTAFRRGRVDMLIMGALDVLLAFPPLLFVLLFLTTGSHSVWLVVPAVGLIFAPRVTRIVRGAAMEMMVREFVDAAVARGEGLGWILFREVLPNLFLPLLADFGIRLSASIIVIASVGFLGFGEQPPAADWGLMIGENRVGMLLQPSVVAAPVAAIALLTIGINLVADAVVKNLGRSEVAEESRRP